MKIIDFKDMRLSHIMRNLHRDIGYLVLGITLIYCISGTILLFRDKGVFVYKCPIGTSFGPGRKRAWSS